MSKFDWLLRFLNNNPVGVAVKVGIAASLAWLLTALPTFGIHPIVAVAIVPVLVALIDYFNPKNKRFGMVA